MVVKVSHHQTERELIEKLLDVSRLLNLIRILPVLDRNEPKLSASGEALDSVRVLSNRNTIFGILLHPVKISRSNSLTAEELPEVADGVHLTNARFNGGCRRYGGRALSLTSRGTASSTTTAIIIDELTCFVGTGNSLPNSLSPRSSSAVLFSLLRTSLDGIILD